MAVDHATRRCQNRHAPHTMLASMHALITYRFNVGNSDQEARHVRLYIEGGKRGLSRSDCALTYCYTVEHRR